MAMWDIFKVSRKTFVNPRAWLGFDYFIGQNRVIGSYLKSIFVPPAAVPVNEETFEQSMQRNGMSEADLKLAIKNYQRFTLLFVFLAVLSFCYAFFILFAYALFSGFLLALCVCALLLAQAFKYNFWSLQLTRRNLNITFNDWKKSILSKNGGV